MSILDSFYLPKMVEALVREHHPKEAASLFHHRVVQGCLDRLEDDEHLQVVTCTPMERPAEDIALNEYDDVMVELGNQISGMRNTRWTSNGFSFEFGEEWSPALTYYHRGAVSFWRRSLVIQGGVVPAHLLEALFGPHAVYRRWSDRVGLDGDVQVDVTLFGLQGESLHTDPGRVYHGTYEFATNRSHARLTVEDHDLRSDVALRPLADRLWQAGGFSQCPQYDEDDRWREWDRHL